jgi:hypothetical protein
MGQAERSVRHFAGWKMMDLAPHINKDLDFVLGFMLNFAAVIALLVEDSSLKCIS